MARRLEIHYTPKHGNWLNIAEIEFSALNTQCLDRHISKIDQCIDRGVSFYFKQWGTSNKMKVGRLLEGKTWDDFPKRFG